ncbi:MAG: TolC family protein [Planctomycetaceae bacterium]|nr:TolC family protein [Planctomycetaceae bacterium]
MNSRSKLILCLCCGTVSMGCRTSSDPVPAETVYRTASMQTPVVTESLPLDLVTEVSQEPIESLTEKAVFSETKPAGWSSTLAGLESVALGQHPAILASRQQLAAAQGLYQQAGLPPNPVLQYQSEEIGNEGSSGLHSVRVSQQFVTANKLGLAQQVAAQQAARLSAEVRRTELQVLTELRIAFAQALIAQRRVALANKIVDLSEQSVQSAELLLKAQEISKVALLQAQVEAEQARISADNATTLLAANRRSLAAAVSLDELPEGELVGDLEQGLQTRPWDETLESIASQSPELLAAGSNLDRARWALRLACAQVTPNVTAQVGAGVDTGSDDTYAVLGVTVPLPIRNRNQGNIRAARASVAAASSSIERTRLDLEGRLAMAVGRYDTARRRYERLRDNVLPGAEETFELSKTAFGAGESNYLTLLTAQRTLVNTQLRILDALDQTRQASAEIDGFLVTLP